MIHANESNTLPGGCQAGATVDLAFYSPNFRVPSNGTHTMVSLWKISWNATGSGSVKSGWSRAYASVNIYVDIIILENIKHNFGRQLNISVVSVYSATGAFSSVGNSQNFTSLVTAKLHFGHSYFILTDIFATAEVGCTRGLFSAGSCSAAASTHATIDMASHGNGAQLVSMTFT
jgi:hypothetical protein